ncbi:hypothetical protein ACROYT_G044690 [Oculina patagonica]
MTATEVFDEILALKSIFCNPGEFYLISPSSLEELESSTGPISFKIAVKCTAEQESNDATKSLEKTEKNTLCFVVEMTVVIPLNYPQTLPEISLSCTEISKKGETDNVREYLRRHKTCNVDVDSSGKPCKERMINVLVQEKAPSNLRICGLGEGECKSLSELEERFTELNLEHFFKEHIKPLL